MCIDRVGSSAVPHGIGKCLSQRHVHSAAGENPAGDMELTFLGTAAGGPPSRDRSFSATALRLPNGSVFLFDCGEGTQRQYIFQYVLRAS